eukprot:4496429-Prymnesium_polylepis.2
MLARRLFATACRSPASTLVHRAARAPLHAKPLHSRGLSTAIEEEALYDHAYDPVTVEDVLNVQAKCQIHREGGDYITAAGEAAGELYAYGHSNVLFKPTKAAKYQFRPTSEAALSYFVGGNVVANGYAEDAGFAINGGKGWADCVYDNHQVEIKNGIGIAMGTYNFTSAEDGGKTKVEYTFGYMRCDDGQVRIFLHHSSVPYAAA